jgi:hypothetical protein
MSKWSVRGAWLCSLLIVMLFFALCCSSVLAESPFPLSIGNAWYYKMAHPWLPVPPISRTIHVVGDSTMPNGKQYWILDQRDIFDQIYVRSDSSHLFYWQYSYPDQVWREQMVFNLQAASGTVDTINWGGFITVRNFGPFADSVFSKATNTRFYHLGGLVFADLTFAEGFGYVRLEDYQDNQVPQYVWTLEGCVISGTVYGTMTDIPPNHQLPAQMELLSNYPNPFNGLTRLTYRLSATSRVRLSIHSVLGQEVAELVNDVQSPGQYSVYYQPSNLASGIYYCQLSASTQIQVRKLLYLK